MDECFVIMPISTPEHMVDTYGDLDHFDDVYKYLFKPAIEKAELTPVQPVAKGSVLIQAEIIERIEKAPLVLCDMSILNPNVFFELGIRTALNKPVCMVKDNRTSEVPFDNRDVNHHTYRCKLTAKELETEIPNLAQHIGDSIETCNGGNPIWKYFGITAFGKAPEGSGGAEAKMDYLIKQFEAVRQSENRAFHAVTSDPATLNEVDDVIVKLLSVAKIYGVSFRTWSHDHRERSLTLLTWDGDMTRGLPGRLAVQARMMGWRLKLAPRDGDA